MEIYNLYTSIQIVLPYFNNVRVGCSLTTKCIFPGIRLLLGNGINRLHKNLH